MPEWDIVSSTDDCDSRKNTTGGIISTSATAAPAPARAMPAEAIWRSMTGSTFMLSS